MLEYVARVGGLSKIGTVVLSASEVRKLPVKFLQYPGISRGICQGSVLSPLLFNLVIDLLLSNLKQRNLGLSVNGLFLGGFAHADDIRSSAANIEDSAEQVAIVDRSHPQSVSS